MIVRISPNQPIAKSVRVPSAVGLLVLGLSAVLSVGLALNCGKLFAQVGMMPTANPVYVLKQ
jgi:hypothetical protein